MSWHWKELLPVDAFTVRVSHYLTDVDQKVLTLLYQPLVGAVAHSMYMTLWAQLEKDQFWSVDQTHRQLMLMMNIPLQTIYEERKKIEAIGLLKTYKTAVDEGSSYVYELQQPMSPKQFFENDVLSVYLFNRLGKQKYRQMRERFTEDKVDLEQYTEMTHSFDEVFHSLHHSEIVSNLQSETSDSMKLNPQSELLGGNELGLSFMEQSFDFELMAKDLSSFIVPDNLLTKEVREAIVRLAFVYRIEPLEMSRIVGQAVIHEDEIDLETLRKKAQDWYKIEHSSEPPSLSLKVHPNEHQTLKGVEPKTEHEKIIKFYETTPPLTLLEIRSEGAQVATADAKIIESLILDYKLLPGVVNVLLDFVLYQHDMKLQKAFIEKIAAHWARKKIKLVSDAMGLAREEQEKKVVAKEQNQARSQGKRQGTKRNTRRDKLPKWLLEKQEKEKQKESISKETVETDVKPNRAQANSASTKEHFMKLLEESRKRKQEKGES
ncbi:replication initiation and membrane attachment family protein [Bacillus sp. FJAT-45037]|uniref:replication initiation and membrane attachment family protein n=1 Tax=Bacillus sp. FJAT-45037 TaxID=2011007 RepID=UPI000C23131A|nr:DnaD domain protein [Bacillus sp. FJAT-45037]